MIDLHEAEKKYIRMMQEEDQVRRVPCARGMRDLHTADLNRTASLTTPPNPLSGTSLIAPCARSFHPNRPGVRPSIASLAPSKRSTTSASAT